MSYYTEEEARQEHDAVKRLILATVGLGNTPEEKNSIITGMTVLAKITSFWPNNTDGKCAHVTFFEEIILSASQLTPAEEIFDGVGDVPDDVMKAALELATEGVHGGPEVLREAAEQIGDAVTVMMLVASLFNEQY